MRDSPEQRPAERHLWQYRICGLDVATDIPLPGAQCPTLPAGKPQVTMQRAAVPTRLEAATSSGPDWAMADGSFFFEVPNVARFLIRHGREIGYSVDDGADVLEIALYLLGSAFGILLHQRGHLVLHASAVAVNGKAVLFSGPSGAGKSTLAAALAREGYKFLNDDVCHIAMNGAGIPVVMPDGRLLKLWVDTLKELALEDRQATRVAKRFDKYYVAPPGEPEVSALPLGAIYGLRFADAADVSIVQLDLAQAVALFRENAYRPLLVAQMSMEHNYFGDSVAALRHANAYYLTRPAAFSATTEVIQRLRCHWASIGL